MARRLAQGDFRLVIAVDAVDPELRRIIEFVNSRGSGGSHLKLVAVAFPRFSEGTTQVIVPETFGDEIEPVPGTTERPIWTEESVVSRFAERGEAELQVALAFRDWAETRGLAVVYAGGRRTAWIAVTAGDLAASSPSSSSAIR